MRQMLGHDGPPTNFWSEHLLTGEQLAECPLRTILRRCVSHVAFTDTWKAAVSQYPCYERGMLLVADSTSDQPSRLLDMMSLIQEMRAATETKSLASARENTDEQRAQHTDGREAYG